MTMNYFKIHFWWIWNTKHFPGAFLSFYNKNQDQSRKIFYPHNVLFFLFPERTAGLSQKRRYDVVETRGRVPLFLNFRSTSAALAVGQVSTLGTYICKMEIRIPSLPKTMRRETWELAGEFLCFLVKLVLKAL